MPPNQGADPIAKGRALLALVRIELPLAAGLCVVTGQVLALGAMPAPIPAILGFLTGLLISASAMASNEYFDLEVDRVNHPNRPLPSGHVTVPELVAMTATLSIGGIVAATLLGPVTLALAAPTWAVGILYNWRAKESGLPGNMMVAFSVAMTFIFGGASVGGIGSGAVWTFGALAFLFDLSEEIAGGAMDVEGDNLRDVRSLARMHGRRFALNASAVVLSVLIVSTLVPYALGWFGLPYLVAVVVTDVALACLAIALRRSATATEGRRVLRRLYLVMVAFVAIFLVTALLL